jgi:hypothetical protein
VRGLTNCSTISRLSLTIALCHHAWARVFLAEKQYGEADRVITRAVRTLEKGGASAYLSDALTVQGVARARMGAGEESINILRRAMSVAEESGALTNAGLAALALIEEHGGAACCRARSFISCTFARRSS